MDVGRHIDHWFVVRQVPQGDAPQEIKQQWVDVPLPIRYQLVEAPRVSLGHGVDAFEDVVIIDDAVDIEGFDAIKALRLFGRPEAADYWDTVLRGYGYPELGFRAREGQLMPAAMIARILPGIELFDSQEV